LWQLETVVLVVTSAAVIYVMIRRPIFWQYGFYAFSNSSSIHIENVNQAASILKYRI